MSEHSKHTPGPWSVLPGSHPIEIAAGVEVIEGRKCWSSICTVSEDDSEGSANAALIVRAVNSHADLLKALNNLQSRVESYFGKGEAGGPLWPTFLDAEMYAARAAIAKAEAA